MEISTRKTFPAEIRSLKKALEWIRGYLLQLGVKSVLIRKVELAFEEAFVNIVEHGYQSQAGEIEVALQGKKEQVLELTLSDQAPKFNPLEVKTAIDKNIPLEKREIGGIGVHFMTQMVDEISYRREKDRNILTFKVKIDCANSKK